MVLQFLSVPHVKYIADESLTPELHLSHAMGCIPACLVGERAKLSYLLRRGGRRTCGRIKLAEPGLRGARRAMSKACAGNASIKR